MNRSVRFPAWRRRDRRQTKLVQGLLHAAQRPTAEVRRRGERGKWGKERSRAKRGPGTIPSRLPASLPASPPQRTTTPERRERHATTDTSRKQFQWEFLGDCAPSRRARAIRAEEYTRISKNQYQKTKRCNSGSQTNQSARDTCGRMRFVLDNLFLLFVRTYLPCWSNNVTNNVARIK